MDAHCSQAYEKCAAGKLAPYLKHCEIEGRKQQQQAGDQVFNVIFREPPFVPVNLNMISPQISTSESVRIQNIPIRSQRDVLLAVCMPSPNGKRALTLKSPIATLLSVDICTWLDAVKLLLSFPSFPVHLCAGLGQTGYFLDRRLF